MEGLLKSAEMSSHSEQIRNSLPNFSPVSSPNSHHLHQNHHHHITAEQVTRDFSSVGSEEHNRGDTVAFLVGSASFFVVAILLAIFAFITSTKG